MDSVVYLMGFARTRQAARQFVNHGHIVVNGSKVDIPSFSMSEGCVVTVRDKTSSRQLATRNFEDSQYRTVPAWLSVNGDSMQGNVMRMPAAEDLDQSINVQLIVEFYSR